MAFSTEFFLAELGTTRFGRGVRLLGETTSTIDVAWEWLREDGPDGGVVIADRQTQGRGRAGRGWASPQGGLWMSAIVRLGLAAKQVGRLGVAVALSVAEGVNVATGCETGVRWPNDVVLRGRKLAGVLGEAEVRGERVARAVLSVGVNVNVRMSDLPNDVRDTATTLLEVTGREHALEIIAARSLAKLDLLWPSVLTDGSRLVEAWQERDVLLGREVVVELGGQIEPGENRGISPDGALRLLVRSGERQIAVGEVSRMRVA